MHDWALPHSLRERRAELAELGRLYKQINAPFGRFAQHMLAAATVALKSGSDSDDSEYETTQGRIRDLTAQRDAIAAQMKTLLNAAAQGQTVSGRTADTLIVQAEALLASARRLAPQLPAP